MRGTIESRNELSDELMELFVTLVNRGEYNFKPGQYADVAIVEHGDQISRLLSFASSPDDEPICFVIKKGTSDYKKYLQNAPLPISITISEPTGVFTLPRPKRPKTITAIVDQIGITPLLSISAWRSKNGCPHEINVVQISETPHPKTIPNYLHLSDLCDYTPDSSVDRFYVSGATNFVAKTKEYLNKHRIDPYLIVEEPFTGY